MIALRPPSYHTIEDPPPYPDDDDDAADQCSMADVVDKRPRRTSGDQSGTATMNRAGVERRLANSAELMRLRDHDDADHRVIRKAVRQYRDAVGHRHHAEPSTSVEVTHSGQMDGSRAPWSNTTTWRFDGSEPSTRNGSSGHSWRYDHRRHLPAGGGGSPFSPIEAIFQSDDGSPRSTDRSVGVPYSVTCPSRFDGGLVDGARRAQPVAMWIPRPSSSVEPVASGPSGDRTCRPGSRQTSSVFEISSYIIANSASDTTVQPSVTVEFARS